MNYAEYFNHTTLKAVYPVANHPVLLTMDKPGELDRFLLKIITTSSSATNAKTYINILTLFVSFMLQYLQSISHTFLAHLAIKEKRLLSDFSAKQLSYAYIMLTLAENGASTEYVFNYLLSAAISDTLQELLASNSKIGSVKTILAYSIRYMSAVAMYAPILLEFTSATFSEKSLSQAWENIPTYEFLELNVLFFLLISDTNTGLTKKIGIASANIINYGLDTIITVGQWCYQKATFLLGHDNNIRLRPV